MVLRFFLPFHGCDWFILSASLSAFIPSAKGASAFEEKSSGKANKVDWPDHAEVLHWEKSTQRKHFTGTAQQIDALPHEWTGMHNTLNISALSV